MSALEGIDPNPNNFVSAGILHMRNQQVGCLLRLEPNVPAQVSLIDTICCFVQACVPSYFWLLRKVCDTKQMNQWIYLLARGCLPCILHVISSTP